jgi:hypothetical protein
MDIWDAVKYGDIPRIKTLLEQGADINAGKHGHTWTPLFSAIRFSNETSSFATVKFLIDNGANVNIIASSSNPLNLAANYGTPAVINLLLDKGANINDNSYFGQTPLSMASLQGKFDNAKTLIDRGADVNIKDERGQTALLYAKTLEIVKLLLDHGADPFIIYKIKDANGNTIEQTIFDVCTKKECRKLVSEYMWKILSATDKKLLKMTSPILIPELRELIIFRKTQQQLCKNLGDEKNKYILYFFAIELGIPVNEEMTKSQLCNIISTQLASGRKHL